MSIKIDSLPVSVNMKPEPPDRTHPDDHSPSKSWSFLSKKYFDTEVAPDGYRWWYIDVVSEDHKWCLVVIAFIGSVFSPYYARERRRNAGADPFAHCAVNAVLYGPHEKHWAMTERSARQLRADDSGFALRGSHVRRTDDGLDIVLDERCTPLPRRLQGRISLQPLCLHPTPWSLHTNGRHHWWPVAPVSAATVKLEHPRVRFRGRGYIDSNFGDEPLERGFRAWDWTRREVFAADGHTPDLTYHTIERDGQARDLTLAQASEGGLVRTTTPRRQLLAPALWQVGRSVGADEPVTSMRTLEDTPFYVRSLLTLGRAESAFRVMHESLDLDRFASGWVQRLLPFRMPRAS